MNILEKEIEELLEICINDDRFDFNHYYGDKDVQRQFSLTGYGIIDLLTFGFENIYRDEEGFDIQPVITIYELKKEKIDANALMQLSRYIKGMKRYIDKIDDKALNQRNKQRLKNNIRGVLIGKTLEKNGDFVYLMELVNNIKVFTYNLDLFTGLKFEKQDFEYYSGDEVEINSGVLKDFIYEAKDNFMNSQFIADGKSLNEQLFKCDKQINIEEGN